MTPAGMGPSGTVDAGRRAKLPQANIAVANRTSHGTSRAKKAAGRQQQKAAHGPANKADQEQRLE